MPIIRGPRAHTPQTLDGKFFAHRNKLLGLWAAERMGMMGETAVDYALGLIATEASKTHNDAALVKKVCEDMSARGYPITEGDVNRRLAACSSEARAQIPQDPES